MATNMTQIEAYSVSSEGKQIKFASLGTVSNHAKKNEDECAVGSYSGMKHWNEFCDKLNSVSKNGNNEPC